MTADVRPSSGSMASPPGARQYPRYAIDATVEVLAPGGGAPVRGRTRDLSRGGLSATVDGEIRSGAVVELRLALRLEAGHTSEPLVVPARVVWSTPLGGARQLGLAFLALTAAQAADLELFVRFLEDGRDHVVEPRLRSSMFDTGR